MMWKLGWKDDNGQIILLPYLNLNKDEALNLVDYLNLKTNVDHVLTYQP